MMLRRFEERKRETGGIFCRDIRLVRLYVLYDIAIVAPLRFAKSKKVQTVVLRFLRCADDVDW